jgi:hypothetical protein
VKLGLDTGRDLDALFFAWTNVHANLSADNAADIEVARLDWNQPHLEGRFDAIVGPEAICKDTDFEPIL